MKAKIFVCAMLCMATISFAQTKKTYSKETTTKETYVEEYIHPQTGVLMETRIWDTYDDYLIGKEIKTNKGWVAGWGSASGNIFEEEDAAYNLKNTAQEAAYDQIAGLMAKEIVKKSTKYRDRTNHNGQTDNTDKHTSGLQTEIRTELPMADKACSYTIKRDANGNVTIYVGVAINMADYNAIKKGHMTKEDVKETNSKVDDFFK